MLWFFFQVFAALDGLCDALMWSQKGADSFKWNEHRPLVTRRGFAVLAACGAGWDAVHFGDAWAWWLGCQVVACALSFSLFHNETYNFGRVWIQEQTFRKAWAAFRFNYQSPTTSARWDFDGTERWVLAGGAVLVFCVGGLLLAKL